MASPLWPLALYIALAAIVVLGMLGLSFILGGRRVTRVTSEPFESGIVPAGTARIRFGIKYFRVALFFVIFDLEVAFLVAWAVAARELGWSGYVSMVVFVGVLLLTLIYLWRMGALDWAGRRRSPPARSEEAEDRS